MSLFFGVRCSGSSRPEECHHEAPGDLGQEDGDRRRVRLLQLGNKKPPL